MATTQLSACRESAAGGLVDAAFAALDASVRAAAAACGMPTRTLGASASDSPRIHAPFFDAECRQLRRQVRASARHGGDPGEVHKLERTYHFTCSRTGACLRSDAVSDGWMTDVVLCLISQSESYSPAQYHVL